MISRHKYAFLLAVMLSRNLNFTQPVLKQLKLFKVLLSDATGTDVMHVTEHMMYRYYVFDVDLVGVNMLCVFCLSA